MGDQEITEAANSVQQVVGTSAYLHGIDYSPERFKRELSIMADHARRKAGARV